MGFWDYVDPNPLHAGKVSKAWTDKLGLTQPAPPDLSQSPDAQRERDFATGLLNQYKNYQPQAAPTVDTTNSDQSRQSYLAALDMMGPEAQGAAPSAAAARMTGGLDQNLAARFAMAGGARNLPAVLSSAAAGGTGVIDQAGQARADELARARESLYRAALGLRGQDIGREQFLGDLSQRQLQMNNQYRLGLGNLAESSLLDPYQAALDNQERQERNAAGNQTGMGGLIKTGIALL